MVRAVVGAPAADPAVVVAATADAAVAVGAAAGMGAAAVAVAVAVAGLVRGRNGLVGGVVHEAGRVVGALAGLRAGGERDGGDGDGGEHGLR